MILIFWINYMKLRYGMFIFKRFREFLYYILKWYEFFINVLNIKFYVIKLFMFFYFY